jgi:hypothetical protein
MSTLAKAFPIFYQLGYFYVNYLIFVMLEEDYCHITHFFIVALSIWSACKNPLLHG